MISPWTPIEAIHTRHRVQLPSGKQIDVVYRNQISGAPTPTAVTRPDPLHVCFHCAGELAYPLDWVEEGPRHWRIVLRCPECEARPRGRLRAGRSSSSSTSSSTSGTSALLSDLRQLTQANMEDEVEFFIRALDADLIVPSDFLAPLGPRSQE